MLEKEQKNEEPLLGRCTLLCGSLDCITYGCVIESGATLPLKKRSRLLFLDKEKKPDVVAYSAPPQGTDKQ